MLAGIQVIAAAWILAWTCSAQADATSLQRWGQAIAYIPSPPAIILHGGKSDTVNAFSYTSAPNSAETILIPLDTSFAASSPPLLSLSSSDAPAYAWHTLTPFSNIDGKWDLLSFGGDAGQTEPTQTQSDSAWYMTFDSTKRTSEWTRQPSGWGNQPSRRIYHSAVGGEGKVYITGGLRNDGSGIPFAETYAFDPASGFTQIAPLPRAVYHHGSVLLPNGTLIVLGGVSISMASGVPAAQSLATISILDTTVADGHWAEREILGTSPSPRRGMATVLSNDGKEIFIHGGASTTFDDVYADSWTLNLETLQWRQLGQPAMRRMISRQMQGEPGGRYDHSAVLGPDGQVVILGYGGDGVADPGPFVFDLPAGTWSSEYTPQANLGAESVSAPASSDTASSTSAAETASESASVSGDITPSSTVSDARSVDSLSSAPSESESFNAPSSSASSSREGAGPLPLPAQLGIIFGIVAIAALILGGLIWRYRRRKRHERLIKAIYGSNAPTGPPRPYGDREKGGEGLMEEARQEEYNEYKNVAPLSSTPSSEKGVGLGMGTIKASFASLRHFRREQPSETYAVLNDEGPSEGVSPVRQPTRRSCQGIRLLGPRSQRASYTPMTSPQSIATGDSRRDMLSDEDSRKFVKDRDWDVREEDVGRWTSAQSILADHTEDPFEDDDDSLRPPIITGGPVPTPYGSRTSLTPDPFHERDISDGDFGLPQVPSDPLDLAGLLPPTSHKRYSAMSGLSGPSSAISDSSEGVIQYAHIGSPASTSLSPESTYMPIKRTDTFFKRMAAGGITSLLSTKSVARSTSIASNSYNIRDPAPPPSLWPVVSRDMLSPRKVESGLSERPPTAWKGEDLKPVRPTHHHGPSLTSITSARSMRDMVIVQREPTDSSAEAESAMIETTSPEPIDGPFDDRHGTSPGLKGDETPGSIVFDGADFAMSPPTEIANQGISRQPPIHPVPIINAPTTPTNTRIRSIATHSPSSSVSPNHSVPPSGSPIPHPVLMHRRPVSEMVNSINKRGSGGDTTPVSLFSPQSRYSSPASTPRQGRVRPTTLYEAVKRDRLLVANPDGK